MAEPRTHYQVSFTARQAIFFFAVFLGALAGAYFLGVATGIAGRPVVESASAAAATPAPAPAATEAPSRGVPTPATIPTVGAEPKSSPPALAAREPSSERTIQFFEDRPEETPSAATTPKKKAPAAPSSTAGFWIQVLSTRSEKEANALRSRLASSGYHVAVSSMPGAKGEPRYRVRVGPYASREEAAKVSESLDRSERVKSWIAPPGK